jgi:single-strand DNA-binding protein
MAKSFNQVIIMGNLTRDPELRTIPSGQSVCSFSIAVNRSWTGADGQTQESTDYFDIVAWAKLGELVSQYMRKGRKCLVVGRLQTRSWEAQDGSKRKATEIVANDVTFLDGGGQAGSNEPPAPAADSAPAPAGKQPDVVVDDIDDDKPIDLSEIPF